MVTAAVVSTVVACGTGSTTAVVVELATGSTVAVWVAGTYSTVAVVV